MKCPNCGTENDNRNVCIKCGTFIGGRKLAVKDLPRSQRNKIRRERIGLTAKSCLFSSAIIVGAFIVMGLIVVGIFFLIERNIDPVPTVVVTDEAGAAVTDAEGSVVYETLPPSDETDPS